jgi:hypothetical protein
MHDPIAWQGHLLVLDHWSNSPRAVFYILNIIYLCTFVQGTSVKILVLNIEFLLKFAPIFLLVS